MMSTPSRKSPILAFDAVRKMRMSSSGLMSRAIWLSPDLRAVEGDIIAPAWRLKLTRSKRSMSAIVKAPMPRRAR